MIAAILQLFLVAMAQNDGMKRLAPGQWMLYGVAAIGMTFAGALLVT
jgi:hypothetical protein